MRRRPLLVPSCAERCRATSFSSLEKSCTYDWPRLREHRVPWAIGQRYIFVSCLLQEKDAWRIRWPAAGRKFGQAVGVPRFMSHVRAELERWRDEHSNGIVQWDEALFFNTQAGTDTDNGFVRSEPNEAPEIDDDEIEAHTEMSSLLDRLITEGEDNGIATPLANVGDFVDVKVRSNDTRCGVFLGMVGQYAATFLANGKLFLHAPHRINFVLPGFARDRDVKQLLKHLPKSSFGWNTDFKQIRDECGLDIEDIIPYDVGLRLRTKILLFTKEADGLFRHYSRLFDTMHEHLAAEDRALLIKPNTISSMLWGRRKTTPSPAFQFAAYRAANDTLGLTYSDSGRLSSEMVEVCSKQDVDLFQRVQTYVRAYVDERALVERGDQVPLKVRTNSGPLKHFIKTYGKLRDYSKSKLIHYQGGDVDDVATPVAFKSDFDELENDSGVASFANFSLTDLQFIRFLLLQSLKSPFENEVTLRSTYNTILRVCEPNANQIDTYLARNILVYMGIVAPTEPFVPIDMHIQNSRSETLDAIRQMEYRVANGEGVEDAFNLKQDRMLNIRRDWKDLAAFAIDADYVSIFDDAISFEGVPDKPEECWFRIHIAEPTAFIDPTSDLAKLAKGRNKAIYLATGRLSMLPDEITKYFSLGPGKPVITYSAKLDSTGNILETSIEPGYIDNVIHYTPEKINSATFGKETAQPEHFLFGAGTQSAEKAAPNIATPYERIREVDQFNNTFREAFRFIEAFRKHRGEELYPTKQSSRKVKVQKGQSVIHGTDVDTLKSSPSFILESPNIEITNALGNTQDTPASRLVEGAAHLANAIAGEWCVRRRIPVPFHGLAQRFGGLQADDYAALRDEVRRASTDTFADTQKNWRLRARMMSLIGIRTVATDPVPHTMLKDPHRTRITNPLRSYIDLVSTWQIESALLEEHHRNKSLVNRPASDDDTFLTFQKPELKDIIDEYTYLDNYSRLFQAIQTEALQFNAIARAIATDDPRFPRRLTAVVSNISKRGDLSQSVRARIQELDISAVGADKVSGEDGNVIRMGDMWEVKITSVPAVPREDIQLRFVRRLESRSENVTRSSLADAKAADGVQAATA